MAVYSYLFSMYVLFTFSKKDDNIEKGGYVVKSDLQII